jgi:hypothetical protein
LLAEELPVRLVGVAEFVKLDKSRNSAVNAFLIAKLQLLLFYDK